MKQVEIIDLERILDYEWDGESEITCKPDPLFMNLYYIIKEKLSLKLLANQCKSNLGFIHLMDWLKEYNLVFEILIFKDHGTKESRELIEGLSNIENNSH